MWVWQSMSPGSTVARDRSMTVAPGGIGALPGSETLSIRLPRMTITWPRRGALDLPSISVPARMTVTAAVSCASAVAAASKHIRTQPACFMGAGSGSRDRMFLLAKTQHRPDGLSAHLLGFREALKNPAVLKLHGAGGFDVAPGMQSHGLLGEFAGVFDGVEQKGEHPVLVSLIGDLPRNAPHLDEALVEVGDLSPLVHDENRVGG